MKQDNSKRMTRILTTLFVTLSAFLFSQSSFSENYPYRSDYLWLTIPDHADWLYKTGEHAKTEVTLCKYGIPQNV